VQMKVAFKYPPNHKQAGKPLPKEHPTRQVLVCAAGNTDGYDVIWPYACNNWSVGKVIPLPPPKSAELVCVDVPFDGSEQPAGSHFHLSGLYHPWSCSNSCGGCNSTLPVQDLHMDSDHIHSSGDTEECLPRDWFTDPSTHR